MKKLLITLGVLLLYTPIFSQKYLKITPTQAPDSAGCNGKVKGIYYGGTAPYQIIWWDNVVGWQPSAGTTVEGLCDATSLYATFADSFCTTVTTQIRLRHDTTAQISLDTIIIVMPSAPGMCDGELYFQFQNIQGTDTKRFGTISSSSIVSGFSFTGLCEDTYYYRISRYSIEYEIQVNIELTPPSPCYYFTADPEITPPTTTSLDSNLCDGVVKVLSNGGSGSPFTYNFIIQTGGGGSSVINSNQYQDTVAGVCQGPMLIDIMNDNNLFWNRKVIYLFGDTTQSTAWNEPDTIIPNTDTIVVHALLNCIANYNIPFDTVYISSITSLGSNQYEFEISFVQTTDTINTYVNAILDTSSNFFIDLTLFCEDSTRGMDPFIGKRNLIYYGEKLTPLSVKNTYPLSFCKIYPNPFNDFITCEFISDENNNLNFEILDITGRLVYQKHLNVISGKNRIQIDPGSLSVGVYYLNILSDDKLISVRKIIKE